MSPTELLLHISDSSLDQLNEAILSHHQTSKEELNDKSLSDTQETPAHGKRGHDTEELNVNAPKRAGRKPLDESKAMESSKNDPKQKRKAQNRAAQRAFRERKEKHVAELQARIDELESKDEALIKENENLKETLRQLREENYALKDAKFTFEFPLSENNNQQQLSPFTNSNSITSPVDQQFAGYSIANTGESSSSEQLSPHSLTNGDDSPSVDTPGVTFSTDLLQFGLIASSHDAKITNNTDELNFFTPTSSNNNIDSSNSNNYNNNSIHNSNDNYSNMNSHNTATTTPLNQLPPGDLFHGKDDLFSNYREPISVGDDFLFANEDLSNLFAGDNDFFGLSYNNSNVPPSNTSSFPNDLFEMNSQFGLPETPAITRLKPLSFEKKLEMYERVRKAKDEGKRVYDLHQEIRQEIPEFDLNSLCDDLRDKAKCSLSTYKVTSHEVDAFVKCLDRV